MCITNSSFRVLAAFTVATVAGLASGQTAQTIGHGAAVKVADRTATFDALVVNGTPLSDYVESGLFIGTDGDSWIGDGYPVWFDPFHGASGGDHGFYFPFGGSQGWTEIRTTDRRPMYAVEFMYGNGWTTGDIYGPYPWGNMFAHVPWQTRRNGHVVSSGDVGVDSPLMSMGTIVGFSDPAGFDELWVKCVSDNSGDPSLQALALDNLAVQLHWVACPADFDGDGTVDFFDYDAFVVCFEGGACPSGKTADFDGDGAVDFFDYDAFVVAFESGC